VKKPTTAAKKPAASCPLPKKKPAVRRFLEYIGLAERSDPAAACPPIASTSTPATPAPATAAEKAAAKAKAKAAAKAEKEAKAKAKADKAAADKAAAEAAKRVSLIPPPPLSRGC
jgi:hypothetical protein